MSDITPPRVFISYSHDSDTHAGRVRELSNRLRGSGIDCRIDQYVAAPPEGWPLWMDKQVEESDFVLVVFTERYVRKSREERQSGVRFESVLILQDLYEAGMINERFIPAVFDSDDQTHILKWLRPHTRYVVSDDNGYEDLRRRLLDDPAIIMPPLGVPTKMGPAASFPVSPDKGAVAGAIKPGFSVVGRDTQPPPHRPLLRDMERALASGELKDSELGPLVLKALQRETDVGLAQPYDSRWITTGIRVADSYFRLIRSSAGVRDWQRDLAKTLTPILVGVVRSLTRSPDAQAVMVRLCEAMAERLRLTLVWPDDPDELNDVRNVLYRECLGAVEVECDAVLIVLQRLSVIGPN